MGQVIVTLNGRSYKLRCGDGEEARLLELASYVEGRLGDLRAEFGTVGDDRLLVMTSLLIADEVFDAREALAARSATGLSTREALAPIAPIPELPALASIGFDSAPALEPVPEAQSTADPDAYQNRESSLNRALRRSDTPVSINERLADARESANLRPSERKGGY